MVQSNKTLDLKSSYQSNTLTMVSNQLNKLKNIRSRTKTQEHTHLTTLNFGEQITKNKDW
jgi:hypothetical protein